MDTLHKGDNDDDDDDDNNNNNNNSHFLWFVNSNVSNYVKGETRLLWS